MLLLVTWDAEPIVAGCALVQPQSSSPQAGRAQQRAVDNWVFEGAVGMVNYGRWWSRWPSSMLGRRRTGLRAGSEVRSALTDGGPLGLLSHASDLTPRLSHAVSQALGGLRHFTAERVAEASTHSDLLRCPCYCKVLFFGHVPCCVVLCREISAHDLDKAVALRSPSQ